MAGLGQSPILLQHPVSPQWHIIRSLGSPKVAGESNYLLTPRYSEVSFFQVLEAAALRNNALWRLDFPIHVIFKLRSFDTRRPYIFGTPHNKIIFTHSAILETAQHRRNRVVSTLRTYHWRRSADRYPHISTKAMGPVLQAAPNPT